jgi:AraC-like DNA-binding protein
MNIPSSLQCFYIQVGAQTSKDYHTHQANELFICTNSSGYQYAGNASLRQRRGNIFCFPAGMPHYCSGTATTPAAGYVLMLPDQMFIPGSYGDNDSSQTLNKLMEMARRGSNPLPLTPASFRRILNLCLRLTREMDRKQIGYQAAARILVQEILLTLMRDPRMESLPPPRWTNRHGGRIARLLWHIDTHFTEKITIRAAAQTTGLSRSQFHALFKETTGNTLVDYVTRLRVAAAQRRLRESDEKVMEIALNCGFSTMSRFYTAYRHITGETPRQIRCHRP